MRIIRYFKNHVPAVVLVVALLIVQAICDLALPNYTSQIVDVGIQQSGIERVSTQVVSQRTFDIAAMLSDEDDERALRDSYALGEDGIYALTDFGNEHREELDRIMGVPLIAAHYRVESEGVDIDALLAAYRSGSLAKADLLPALDQARTALSQAGDALVGQQAIAAARAEYDALGVDVGQMQRSYLVRVGLSMLGVAALGMVAAIGVGFLSSRTAAKIGRRLRARLFERVVAFSDAEVGSFSAASLITRGTNDITLIQNVCVMLQRMVLYAPIVAIGGIFMVMQTNVSMSWIIVLAVVVVTALVLLLMKIALPRFKIMQKLIDRVNLVSRELLTGMPVIRAFDREAHEQARFEAASADLMDTQLFTNRVMTFMMPLMMLVMNGVSVLIVWVGASSIDQGTIQTGDLIAFITYSMVIIMGFLMISMVSVMLPRANVAAERIDEVLETEPSIHDAAHVRDEELLGTPGARIEFRDVCFAYSKGSENVVDHVSFVAEAGKTTAVIGATGSGKSTLLKLMERFYDVDSGSVLVDGVDVRELSQKALRAQFGYVPQRAFLFSGTIRSNVSYSDESMADDRVADALAIAQAADFVASRDQGADSPVAQGGANVSGGQRQRLAIARALASSARAYLFDDSFSALDYKTDAALREQLSTRLAGRTVFIVAQRIATIMHADRILVIDDGRIVGEGTHEQLMSSCDEYREIALSQLSEAELSKGGDAR